MNESKKTRVALVDDHVLLRNALGILINKYPDCQVTVEAGNGQELKETLATGAEVDVALLDLNMPLMDGLETAKFLQEYHPHIRVLMLTMYDSELVLIRLLQAGVRGFLKKDSHPDELRTAIQTVMQTGFFYSHDSTGKIVNLFRKQENGHFPQVERNSLTENEIDFLRLASTELTYKEIAQKTGLNPRAIDNMRDCLFQKLNVRSRVGLAMYAIRHGLVSI